MSLTENHSLLDKINGAEVDIFKNEQYSPAKEKNIVNSWLEIGLEEWRKYAQVSFIEGDPSLQVPIISSPATNIPEGTKPQNILLVSGMHLEEIGGPNALLNPHNFHFLRSQGFSFTIIPVVNQYGLNFPEGSPEEHLRRDENGVNYNDCWGSTVQRTKESVIIIEKIKKLHLQTPFNLVITCHEDSVLPGTGYAFTVGLNEPFLFSFDQKIKATPSSVFLAEFTQEDNPQVTEPLSGAGLEQFQTGSIKQGWQLVDVEDGSALENWVYDDPQLNIPSVTIEGPFASPLPQRVAFQMAMIESALTSLQE